jgi:hypothetical protein
MVKKTINVLTCALITPLAFAQTSTTTTEQKATTQPTTTPETTAASAAASGTVTTYEPGKVIVVGSESAQDTFSYALDKTVRYVTESGERLTST